MNTIEVRAGLLGDTVQLIELASVGLKRALDELAVRKQAAQKAADLVPPVRDRLVATGLVQPFEKAGAEALLATHDGCLQLIDACMTKLAEQAAARPAREPGRAIPAPGTKTAGHGPPTDSHTGRRAAEPKESDRVWFGGQAAG